MPWNAPLFWAVFAIFRFWAFGAYNRLIRLRSAIVQSFDGLDAQMGRLVALVSEFGVARAVYHSSVLDNDNREAHPQIASQSAMTQVSTPLVVIRTNPVQGDAAATLSGARDATQASWRNAVYPLGGMAGLADDGFDPFAQVGTAGHSAVWQVRWDQHVAQSDHATLALNEAVCRFNVAVSQFPASVLAKVFGLQEARLL